MRIAFIDFVRTRGAAIPRCPTRWIPSDNAGASLPTNRVALPLISALAFQKCGHLTKKVASFFFRNTRFLKAAKRTRLTSTSKCWMPSERTQRKNCSSDTWALYSHSKTSSIPIKWCSKRGKWTIKTTILMRNSRICYLLPTSVLWWCLPLFGQILDHGKESSLSRSKQIRPSAGTLSSPSALSKHCKQPHD